LGYTNIKIYNGGIKDWRKSGYPLERKAKLPETDMLVISTDSLYEALQQAEKSGCKNSDGSAIITIFDFRNSNHVKGESIPPQIDTQCPIYEFLLDDLLKGTVRNQIPKQGGVITLTETGNRDEFIIRYLSQFGYNNISILGFGMRGWIKNRYPTR